MSVKSWTQVQLEDAYKRMVKLAGERLQSSRAWEAVAREREARIQELEKKVVELELRLESALDVLGE